MFKGALITIVVLLLFFAATVLTSCSAVESKVAVIPLNGPVQFEAGGFLFFTGSAITPQLVRSQLDKARADWAVKAVVLQIESPGGSAAACQEILTQIEKLEKPIVVSFGSVAASGGYYIASKADKIVALPATLTGSIGVISQIPNIKGLYDKLGINMEVFKGGKYKDMYTGLRELTSEERELMQKMTDQFYEQFVNTVAEGRGLDVEKVRSLATGQLYTGEQAKELGLVDELGGLDTAIDLAGKLAGVERPKVEYYRREAPSLLSSLLGLNLKRLQGILELQLLGAENMLILQTLSNPYPQPEYR
ncbi:MAG: signal peptide peptidase SppA [Chloroflexi bacterium]|nr:signal peptide peptidase SppA [Chloroflexota bacterium]MBM3172265.1 signal peptide peptidase SppA [Chloroflexota bacterium]MBM3174438.1 signal peptide peptidase SppA [Chloroflexota bacterium]MBM4449610.1 signal peptide peptidase SppA [Chloroflexota bacterium]